MPTLRPRYLGLLRRRRGHQVELPGGVRGDPGQGPVLLALRRPRQPLLEHARGRRQGGQGHPDPGRPRPFAPASIDPGLLARGRGRSDTAHVRHLAEAPAPGTQARRHHRHGRGQPLPQGGLLPQHNARFATAAEDRGTALSPSPARSTTSCASTRNAPSQTDNTVRSSSAWHQIPPAATTDITSTRVRVTPRANGRLPWTAMGAIKPMANRSTAKPARPLTRFDATTGSPWQVDSRSATGLPHP